MRRDLPGWSRLVLAGMLAAPSGAAELQPQTRADWERYVAATEAVIERELADSTRFLARDHRVGDGDPGCDPIAQPGRICVAKMRTLAEDGSRLEMRDGMVHHWLGSTYIPGVGLAELLDWVRDYDHQAAFFDEVEAARLLARDGEILRVFFRLRRKKIVTVHYDTEHRVSFRRHGPGRASARAVATRIAELDHAGTPRERELPEGRDRGFLWRLNAYWRYLEVDGGVVVECEALSLSRGVPVIARWLVRPFLDSVPRESLEATLDGIRRGVSGRGPGVRRSGG